MRILITDDDKDLASALGEYVQGCGHEVVSIVTTGGLDIIRCYGIYKPDVVMMDIMMPRFNGLTVAHALLSKDPQARIVLFSGQLNSAHPFIVNSGAVRFLQKPIHLFKIRRVLAELSGEVDAAA